MLYCDTDVLVHAVFHQDVDKHFQAKQLVESSIIDGSLVLSYLAIQEFVFVLAKLNVPKNEIDLNYNFYKRFVGSCIDADIMNRGYELALQTSFRDINDCLHLAFAEKHADRIVTFNKKDFKKLSKHTALDVKVLT